MAAPRSNDTVPLPCASGRNREPKAAGPWRRSRKTRSRYSPERLFYSREDPARTTEVGRIRSLCVTYRLGHGKCRVDLTSIPRARRSLRASADVRVLRRTRSDADRRRTAACAPPAAIHATQRRKVGGRLSMNRDRSTRRSAASLDRRSQLREIRSLKVPGRLRSPEHGMGSCSDTIWRSCEGASVGSPPRLADWLR